MHRSFKPRVAGARRFGLTADQWITVLPVAMLILALLVLAFSSAGCTQQQVDKFVQRGSYITGGPTANPATQPSEAAALEAGRAIVQTIGVVYPPAWPFIAGAGALFGILGRVIGRKQTARKYNGYVGQIVEDIAAFKDPATPWPADLEKLLIDLGHAAAVLTEPAVGSSAVGSSAPPPAR